MQEEKAHKIKRFIKKVGLMNLICIAVFTGSLLISAACVAWMYRNVHTNSFGEYATELPWVGSGITVINIQSGWTDVSDNNWMKMNEITKTPYIQLELAPVQGSGTLFVQFKNEKGHYLGQPVGLVYRDGQFEATDRHYYRASGNAAVVYGYPVFDTSIQSADEQFLSHCIDERQKHWLAEVSFIPSDTSIGASSGRIFLGHTTIAKKLDKETSKQ